MMTKILFFFLLYGFIGWCYESTLVSIREKQWVNRGFLMGPIIPIYAFGSLFMVLNITHFSQHLPENLFAQVILLFVVGALACTILEYAVSVGMEVLFDTKWWDYTDLKLDINGRICLRVTLIWGAGSLVLWYLIHPQVLKLYQLIPFPLLAVILTVLLTVFAIDLILTLKSLIDFRKVVKEINKLKNELRQELDQIKSIEEELHGKMINLQERFAKRQRRLLLAFPHLKTRLIDEWVQEVKENIRNKK